MSKFKVGDKVRCIDNTYKDSIILTISYIDRDENRSSAYDLLGFLEDKHERGEWYAYHFELVQDEKESIKHVLKTQPWWIAVRSQEEYNNVQKWLEDNYGSRCIANYTSGVKYLTNTTSSGDIETSWVMHGSDSKPKEQEIKLEFKTIVESVELPVVESKEEVERKKKIQELKETIALAQKQLEEMK